jgi:hypothetical protein
MRKRDRGRQVGPSGLRWGRRHRPQGLYSIRTQAIISNLQANKQDIKYNGTAYTSNVLVMNHIRMTHFQTWPTMYK